MMNMSTSSFNATNTTISQIVSPSASYWKRRALRWGMPCVLVFFFRCISLLHWCFCSEATVARRRKALGLLGSKCATRDTSDIVKRQLVLDQLAKDPNGRKGPRLIRESIVFDTGIPLTLWVTVVMMMIYWGFTTFKKEFYHTRNASPGARGLCLARTHSK